MKRGGITFLPVCKRFKSEFTNIVLRGIISEYFSLLSLSVLFSKIPRDMIIFYGWDENLKNDKMSQVFEWLGINSGNIKANFFLSKTQNNFINYFKILVKNAKGSEKKFHNRSFNYILNFKLSRQKV